MFVGMSILKGDFYTHNTTWTIMLVCILLLAFIIGTSIIDEIANSNIIGKILFGIPIYSILTVSFIYTLTGILYYLIVFVKFLWNSA